MNATPGGVLSRRSRAQLAALLKVQAKLSLREPYGLGLGVGLPAVLQVVFGFISKNVPGNVGGSGLTVIDLYVPTLMVISFIAITISLPNSLVKDREIGWLRRISTTPVHPSRLLAAQLILNLLFAVAGDCHRHCQRSSDLRRAAGHRHPVLHPVPRTGHCRDLLAGTDRRGPGPDADRGQRGRQRALLRPPLPVRIVGSAAANRRFAKGASCGTRRAARQCGPFSTRCSTRHPPVTTLLTLVGDTLVFTVAAVRYFRWE
jgi:hypothetical protein